MVLFIKKRFSKIFFSYAILMTLSLNNAFAQDNSKKIYEVAVDNFEKAKLLVENTKDHFEALDALNLLETTNPVLFGGESPITGFLDKVSKTATYIDALRKDAESAITNHDNSFFLKGELIRELGKSGIDLAFKTTIDAWEEQTGMKNLGSTFGLDELAKGIFINTVDNRLTIDAITHYLDALNQCCWGIVGYLQAGGPANHLAALQNAKAYQQLAGIAARQFRNMTMPFFEMISGADKAELKAKLLEGFYTLQIRRLHDGLTEQYIDDVYSLAELYHMGFNEKEILKINEQIRNDNIHICQSKSDFTFETVKNMKTGKATVGGVMIDPKIDYTQNIPDSISIATIKSRRPSQDSLTWDYSKQK